MPAKDCSRPQAAIRYVGTGDRAVRAGGCRALWSELSEHTRCQYQTSHSESCEHPLGQNRTHSADPASYLPTPWREGRCWCADSSICAAPSQPPPCCARSPLSRRPGRVGAAWRGGLAQATHNRWAQARSSRTPPPAPCPTLRAQCAGRGEALTAARRRRGSWQQQQRCVRTRGVSRGMMSVHWRFHRNVHVRTGTSEENV
eukprot:1414483-Rhodomonas_salina.3